VGIVCGGSDVVLAASKSNPFFLKNLPVSRASILIKNTLYIFAGRASNVFFLFLLALVVSRQLGPAFFGVFSFLTTVVVSASCFSNLGLDVWMVREITKTPEKARHYLSSILGLKTATSLVTIALVFIIFQMTDLSEATRQLLGILSISILFNTISQTLWHYGDCFKEFFYHSFLWAVSNIIKSLLGIALVLSYGELKTLVVGIVLAEAIALTLSVYIIRRRFGRFTLQFQFSVWMDFLSRSSPIAMGAIFSALYFRLDIVMLQLMTDDRVVGFYSAAYKLFEIALVLPQTLMLVLFPSLVEEFYGNRSGFKKRLKKALAVYCFVGSSLALVFFVFSNEIINFIYGEGFLFSAEVLNVLAIATPLFFLNYLLSNILIVSGQEKVNTWSLVGITAFNIALNLLWIPEHGAIGAGWAKLICEIGLITVLGIQSQKVFKEP
jgi:O-antigen/teichoic acid export membrane protein